MKEEEEAWGSHSGPTVSSMLQSSPIAGSTVTQSSHEFQGRLSGLQKELNASLRETASPPPRTHCTKAKPATSQESPEVASSLLFPAPGVH